MIKFKKYCNKESKGKEKCMADHVDSTDFMDNASRDCKNDSNGNSNSGFNAVNKYSSDNQFENNSSIKSKVNNDTISESPIENAPSLSASGDDIPYNKTDLQASIDNRSDLQASIDNYSDLQTNVDNRPTLQADTDNKSTLHADADNKSALQADGDVTNNNNKTNTNTNTNASTGTNMQAEKAHIKRRSFKNVSWPILIITVIAAMIITSALTIVGLRFYGVRLIGTNDTHSSAVKYSLEKATGSKLTIPEIVEKNQNAVVEINTEALSTDSFISNLVKEGAGSGVIIDSSGYILTCNHVIKDAQAITVTLRDGNQYPATLIGFDDKLDLAVIKISGKNFSTVTYGDSGQLKQGSMAVAIGNPLGQLGGSVSAGIISALDREINLGGIKMHLLQTDVAINPGNSGGGLFDDEGRLIGIVVAKTGGSNVEGIGFAIPINTAAKVAKDLIENGKVTDRAIIGVSILNVPTEDAARAQGVKLPGVYVIEAKSKEAKEAGFEKGDLIAYVAGEETPTSAELFQVLSKHKIGDKVDVVILRNGKTKTLTTKLTSN